MHLSVQYTEEPLHWKKQQIWWPDALAPEGKKQETGDFYGIAADRLYASYEEMAKAESAREDGIDFVSIVTPNATHYEVAKAFLEAGIHVACEKPLCFTVEQGEELERIAKEKASDVCSDLYLHWICNGKTGQGTGSSR